MAWREGEETGRGNLLKHKALDHLRRCKLETLLFKTNTREMKLYIDIFKIY